MKPFILIIKTVTDQNVGFRGVKDLVIKRKGF